MTFARTVAAMALVSTATLSTGAPQSTRPAWTQVTASAAWSKGYSFSAVALRDTLWILGHREGNWFSADGRTWTRATSNVDFTMGYATFVVFNDEIVAIGGTQDRSKLGPKAVWHSRDGRQWTLLTDHPAWSARVWQTTVVRDGRIWLMGGWDGSDRNDVWSSTDGVQWTQTTRSAEWSKRFGVGAAAWDGKLWMMGGGRFFRLHDVWTSTDGAHWTREEDAAWSKRFGLATVVFRDAIWVMGGKEGGGIFTNDVWRLSRSGN